jgi:peptide/nickel transport system permease protein
VAKPTCAMGRGILGRYICVRIVQALPLMLGVVIITFFIVHLAPGDPVQAIVGDYPAPPELVARLRHEFGLDQPIGVQLLVYLERVATGNLGYSFAEAGPVLSVITDRLGATLLLAGTAWVVATTAGLSAGILAALHPGSRFDALTNTTTLLGFALPEFWFGQLLILLFALKLGWLPPQGMTGVRHPLGGLQGGLDVARHLVLPALVLSSRYVALYARITRSSMADVLSREYMTTARSKGLAGRRVLLVHALRNALPPIVTTMGFNLGFLLAGSILVETVFAWPGIGRLLFVSISMRDYPVLLGILQLVTLGVIAANLITDVAYAFLDPRVQY